MLHYKRPTEHTAIHTPATVFGFCKRVLFAVDCRTRRAAHEKHLFAPGTSACRSRSFTARIAGCLLRPLSACFCLCLPPISARAYVPLCLCVCTSRLSVCLRVLSCSSPYCASACLFSLCVRLCFSVYRVPLRLCGSLAVCLACLFAGVYSHPPSF